MFTTGSPYLSLIFLVTPCLSLSFYVFEVCIVPKVAAEEYGASLGQNGCCAAFGCFLWVG